MKQELNIKSFLLLLVLAVPASGFGQESSATASRSCQQIAQDIAITQGEIVHWQNTLAAARINYDAAVANANAAAINAVSYPLYAGYYSAINLYWSTMSLVYSQDKVTAEQRIGSLQSDLLEFKHEYAVAGC